MRSSLSLLLALAPGCLVLELHEGNGVSVTEVRPVAPFVALANEGSFDVYVSQGETAEVLVTCDENLLEYVGVEVQGDTLVISASRDGLRLVQILPRTDCYVSVVTPDLYELSTSGSGNVSVEGGSPLALAEVALSGSGDVTISAPVVVDALSVLTTGSGEARLDWIEAHDVSLLSTGSGGLEVNGGVAAALELQASGSGDALAAGLVADAASALLTGSGDGELSVVRSLSARLTGSGDLTVWGDPASTDIEESGSGEVTILE